MKFFLIFRGHQIFNVTGQARAGAEKEGVCEVQQEVFQHTEGVFQGRPADHRVHLRHLLDPPDQHGDDHSEGQVRVAALEKRETRGDIPYLAEMCYV